MVLFKRITGFENYWISMEGVVYNAKSDKILKQSVGRDGYLRVGLRKNEKGYGKLVH